MSDRTDRLDWLRSMPLMVAASRLGKSLAPEIAALESMTDEEYDAAVAAEGEKRMQLRSDHSRQADQDPTYRSAMKDAGRGHLLR